MQPITISTPNLDLILQTPQATLAWAESLPPEVQKELSPAWLQKVRAASEGDYWQLFFNMVHRETQEVVGSGGFKGPPNVEQTVEIAYGVEDEHQGKGYATEAAEGLTNFAFTTGQVLAVIAHTRVENDASHRVLSKCHFVQRGLVIDPEDGEVMRWEKRMAD
jgi:[ribosomal protein S5]-alanine N-acetyltransferase